MIKLLQVMSMNNQTIVFKVSDNLKQQMIDFYQDRFYEKKPPYSVFQVRDYDCIITLYESGKVMFQGLGADIEASYWTEQERIMNNRNIYFVPFRQDDCINKPPSLVADFSLIPDTIKNALQKKQLQPVLRQGAASGV